MHYIQADLVEQAVLDFLSDNVLLLPEHLLKVLEDALPDGDMRQALDPEALHLTAGLADVEQVVCWLVDAVERGGLQLEPRRASRRVGGGAIEAEVAVRGAPLNQTASR
jgi:hypothetical protein